MHPLDDELLPNDAAALTEQIAEVDARLHACDEHIADLMRREDPAGGVFFAAEIHAAKQNKFKLVYQRAVRVAKRNRL
ncbi:hypothetical protein [Desulfovibrio cuneatus]|uniref:hypothetical protein n=1 Tax=Desulfovibrio cuneatus TaxID=159728 RepID=UPI00040F97A5|nr:hypothetical protein [Desulfovibrio cuneatus]